MNAAQLKREADNAQAWADASHRGSSVYKELKGERDALLEACKALCPLTHYDGCSGLNWIAGCAEREEHCTCGAAKARAAIARAEGKR